MIKPFYSLTQQMRMFTFVGITISGLAWADTDPSNDSSVEHTDARHSMMNSQRVDLTDDERSLARKWMLTENDWVKYKAVMSGPRGIWSPNLDPITALGVTETDPYERRRYADIWMQLETRRAELELAFEVERMDAAKRIIGNQPLVNNQSWKQQWLVDQNRVKHEVMVFVDVDCGRVCERLLLEVQKTVDERSRLDVYFAPGATAEQIGSWAARMKLDPEAVRRRDITLNFDKGVSTQLGVSMNELPEVHVRNTSTGDVRETFIRW